MKKVININFQGRVIPIEETAYDILKQYVESLRRFFANEEGRDEIINDIEGRIAELFVETLKKGSTCITDDDVNAVIRSMGRPEDFEADEASVQSQLGARSSGQQSYTESEPRAPRGRLYRDENDKLLGGVCAGLANYLRMDPSIVRILFAIITFGGFGAGFLLYILLWIILPKKSLQTQLRKRLYRNPDDKIIAGVASGIAAYFNMAVWIPRLIFALPLIMGIVSSVFQNAFFHFDPFPSILFGSFGSSLFIIYIVLWAVIPQAVTASEKLEMRGEKVDLNTIKTTIQEDLEGFKARAEKWGGEVKDKAQEFGSEVKERGSTFAAEAGPTVRRTGSRFWHAIGILFKGFFLLVAGCIAFALLMVMLWFMVDRASMFPIKDYFLEGFWQNFLAWATMILFLGVPVIAIITWLVRRLMRAKAGSAYLGWIFGGLWTIGWVAVILLIASVSSNYRTRAGVEDNASITQPASDKLFVRVYPRNSVNYYGSDWYGMHWDDDDAPFYALNEDSVIMRTIQVRVVRSDDSMYHTHVIKFSRGNNPDIARQAASHINFNYSQSDSMLNLPQGFTVTKDQKYRNQQVLFVIEVPIGKKIEIDRSVDDYKWINIELNDYHNSGWGVDWDYDWENNYSWRSNREYIMTINGLKPTQLTEEELNEEGERSKDAQQQLEDIQKQKEELEKQQRELEKSMQRDSTNPNEYRYKPSEPKSDSVQPVKKAVFIPARAKNLSTIPVNLIERFTI